MLTEKVTMLFENEVGAGKMCPQHLLSLFLQIQKLFDATLSMERNMASTPKYGPRIHLFDILVLKLNIRFL